LLCTPVAWVRPPSFCVLGASILSLTIPATDLCVSIANFSDAHDVDFLKSRCTHASLRLTTSTRATILRAGWG